MSSHSGTVLSFARASSRQAFPSSWATVFHGLFEGLSVASEIDRFLWPCFDRSRTPEMLCPHTVKYWMLLITSARSFYVSFLMERFPFPTEDGTLSRVSRLLSVQITRRPHLFFQHRWRQFPKSILCFRLSYQRSSATSMFYSSLLQIR